MKPIYLGIIVIGALLVYESIKGLKTNTPTTSQVQKLNAVVPAPQSTSASTNTNPGNAVAPSSDAIDFQALVAQFNLPSAFLNIIPRESGGVPTATCFAPGSCAECCTPYQKPGDTQGAFGLFQFLNSTWNGLGCGSIPGCSPAPSDPLGINYSAYNPQCAAQCAQRSIQQSGLSAWGG